MNIPENQEIKYAARCALLKISSTVAKTKNCISKMQSEILSKLIPLANIKFNINMESIATCSFRLPNKEKCL